MLVAPLNEMRRCEENVSSHFGSMVTRSPCMRRLFAELIRISPSDASVVIEGETGTGKELVADAIHRASCRADRPYVVFDCSAVAPSLVESELFGHERGAFTGALSRRIGVFEQANGGTIFLDEIGELPKDLQPKLLRVLEKREFRRIGSNTTITTDVRVLAATHRNLMSEVNRGNFREDLFFRISTTHVHVPPLRERPDDIPLLMDHFLGKASPPRRLDELPEHTLAMFRAHLWPGNVRELRNAVQRLLLTPERPFSKLVQNEAPITAANESSDVGVLATSLPLRAARRAASEEFERKYLGNLLASVGGNIRRAAAKADVSRQMIQKLMRKHSLN